MAAEHPMAVEIEPLRGLRGLRRRLTVFNKTGLPQGPRLQVMEAQVILGDQKHRRIRTPLLQMTTGVQINQRLVDGVETLTMHQLLELICQLPHLQL
jgi:hypothetical protein